MSAADWRERLLAAPRLAVDRRLVADVPVGVPLSGGVDFSPIVPLLPAAGQKDLQPFSNGLEDAHGVVGHGFGPFAPTP